MGGAHPAPDLVRAVVCEFGIYDRLRVELEPDGPFNATEFGSVNLLSNSMRCTPTHPMVTSPKARHPRRLSWLPARATGESIRPTPAK